MPPQDYVILRQGTLAEWAAKNPQPVLKLGEVGVETDTHRMKIGDGVTAWSALGYIAGTFDLENVPVQVARDTTENLEALTDPFLSGQLVYDTDTGAVMIGDGETLIPGLPDLRKQFQNVVTVSKDGAKGSADFICSDSQWNSDDECIQAAIDYAATKNIYDLLINEGTYVISTKITGSSNLNIRGIGHVTMISDQTSSDPFEIFIFSGGTSSNVSASDALAGSYILTVNDITNISVGDLLLIFDSTLWNQIDYPNLKTGELHEVVHITENNVLLADSLLHTYMASNGLSIQIIHPISITLQNINFKALNASTSNGILQLINNKNSSIIDCDFSDGGYCAIAIDNSLNTEIHKNTITNFTMTGLGYGVAVQDASAGTFVHNNKISNCRHTVAAGGHALIGQARDIHVYNNLLSAGIFDGAEHVVDSHPCAESIYVYDNTLYCNNEKAFVSGAKLSIFVNNKVYHGTGQGTRGNVQHMIYIVQNNFFYSCTYIYYDTLTTNCLVDIAIIENNHSINAIDYMVYTQNTSNVSIKGNSIDQTATYSGILVQNATSGEVIGNKLNNISRVGIYLNACQNIQISDNHILNCNQKNNVSPTYASAITLIDSSNINVTNNDINDLSSKTKYCIYESGTSDNNTFIHNIVKGATVSPIVKIGANTVLSDNIGYIDKNTGTATIPTSSTSIIVNHGLVSAPTRYSVTPSANIGNCWIGTITATQMTIHCSTAPESDTQVCWSAQVV